MPERLYVVRSIGSFLRALENKESVAFGKGFSFDPESMCFEGADRQILEILQEACPPQEPVTDDNGKVIAQPARTGKFLGLGEAAARRLLRLLMARPFRLAVMGEMENQEPVARMKLPVTCTLRAEGAAIALGVEMPRGIQPVLPDYEFARVDGHIVQFSQSQRRAVRALPSWFRADAVRRIFRRGNAARGQRGAAAPGAGLHGFAGRYAFRAHPPRTVQGARVYRPATGRT